MSIETKPSGLPVDIAAELRAAAERAAQGIRDPEAARKSCEHMDQVREAIREQRGIQDVGVEIIRSMRAR